jgi:hypothetical protein
MIEKTKGKIEALSLLVGVVGGVGGIVGMIGAFWLLPYRVQAVEAQVEHLTAAHITDHDTLTRIEERIIAIQKNTEKK